MANKLLLHEIVDPRFRSGLPVDADSGKFVPVDAKLIDVRRTRGYLTLDVVSEGDTFKIRVAAKQFRTTNLAKIAAILTRYLGKPLLCALAHRIGPETRKRR